MGGGDSAVEAALGLAAQPGTTVTLSYRGASLFRIKARNDKRLTRAIEEDKLKCLYESNVIKIGKKKVLLRVKEQDKVRRVAIKNHNVLVMIGGLPPFNLLASLGVSFNPEDRDRAAPFVERGTGLVKAMSAAFLFAFAALLWAIVFREYYLLPASLRVESTLHDELRSSGPFGLFCGVLGTFMVIVNLCY